MNALSPDEVAIVQIALKAIIEDLEDAIKNVDYNFTPEARKYNHDMLKFANSALAKIALASGKLLKMEPYKDGDETEFLTKQS